METLTYLAFFLGGCATGVLIGYVVGFRRMFNIAKAERS